MKNLFDKLNRLSFRSRIILTFTIITVLLVVLMSRLSYYTVRTIYLNQVEDQISLFMPVIAKNIDVAYLKFLEPNSNETFTTDYYRKNLLRFLNQFMLKRTFLFDTNLNILVQTDTAGQFLNPEPALLLNQREIYDLEVGDCITSIPFKGRDGLWYLWGFYRINQNYFIGVQENAARLAKVDRLSVIFWGIGLGGVLLTIFAGWLLAGTLSRPIERLVGFSKKLGEGDFSASMPENIRGELRILAAALDNMRQGLARNQREKEKMLAQIAHEIRNPLGGIELLAGLVKEDMQSANHSTAYIEKILKEISALKELISAYLNYSRPQPAQPEWVVVSRQVEELKMLFRDQLTKKKITLQNKTGDQKIRFDPNHFRQVLLNLIGNSLETMKTGGEIVVSASDNRHQKTVQVSDTGPGIDPQHISRIFDPFFSTKTEGTGLGLAICKKLCAENQAHISVSNNRESGCTFSIIQKNSTGKQTG